MGWSIGFDNNWNRDIGYGVPAICDYPGCGKEIDRGLAHVCGEEPYGGEHGCGLFFCSDHKVYHEFENGEIVSVCERCSRGEQPFEPTPDVEEWIEWKLTDSSWEEYRKENPEFIKENPK